MTAHQLTEVRRVKQTRSPELLDKRNVVGVGLGYKVREGFVTDELCLVVSVTHKVDPSALSVNDLVPKSLDGIKTDVVETGVFRAFQLGTRDRWRPTVPPGVSLGHVHITAGTFGCLVRRGSDLFILSNNHVLANANSGRPGDAILQPGPADGGTLGDSIATLADYVPIDFGTAASDCPVAEWSARVLNYVAGAFGSSHQLTAVRQTAGINYVDAALAKPISSGLVNSEILHIGSPIGLNAAQLGMVVQKTGRTTDYTQGTIMQLDATVRIDYNGPTALFSGQIVASAMSQPGDSGAAILDMDRQLVGLLFAGSDAATVANPMETVFSVLNLELAV